MTTSPGGAASFDVSVGAVNGFSSDVSLDLSGLSGSQATWSFSPSVVAGASGSSQLSIATASTLAPGLYPLEVVATAGTTTHRASATLVVPAPPDFTLAASPDSSTVAVGGAAQFSVHVDALNGFADDVALSVVGLPETQGSWAFSPAVIGGTGSSTLTISTSPTASPGTFPLTITGASGSTTHTAPVTLVVATEPDFGLAVIPGSLAVFRGQSTSYTVAVSAQDGFSSPVTLSVSGLPFGATATFSRNPVGPPGSSVLTVRTSRWTTRGTFTLPITGKSGTLVHQVIAKLTVQ